MMPVLERIKHGDRIKRAIRENGWLHDHVRRNDLYSVARIQCAHVRHYWRVDKSRIVKVINKDGLATHGSASECEGSPSSTDITYARAGRGALDSQVDFENKAVDLRHLVVTQSLRIFRNDGPKCLCRA